MAKKKRNNKKGKCKASRKTAVGQKKQQNQDEDEAIKEEREQHDELLARTMPQMEAAWQRILSRSPDAADGGRDKTDEETEAEKMEVKKFSIEMLQTLLQMLNIGILEKELTEEEQVAAEVHDEVLFKGHPTPNDCDICFLPFPLAANERTYKLCCGKVGCTKYKKSYFLPHLTNLIQFLIFVLYRTLSTLMFQGDL